MSWQDYVDKQLLASRCVTKAAIAGHDGNVWAKSEGFEVSSTPTENTKKRERDSAYRKEIGRTGERKRECKYGKARMRERDGGRKRKNERERKGKSEKERD